MKHSILVADDISTPDPRDVWRNYDAWGKLRRPADWSPMSQDAINAEILSPSATESEAWKWLPRGYTGHEHLLEFDLINMNARLYDPMLARMLAPDNVLGDPTNTQSYNKYSYVINNPLKYTDPSGNNWVDGLIKLGVHIGISALGYAAQNASTGGGPTGGASASGAGVDGATSTGTAAAGGIEPSYTHSFPMPEGATTVAPPVVSGTSASIGAANAANQAMALKGAIIQTYTAMITIQHRVVKPIYSSAEGGHCAPICGYEDTYPTVSVMAFNYDFEVTKNGLKLMNSAGGQNEANVRTLSTNSNYVSNITTYQSITKVSNEMSGNIYIKTNMLLKEEGFSATVTLPIGDTGVGLELQKNFTTQSGFGSVNVMLRFGAQGLSNLKSSHIFLDDDMKESTAPEGNYRIFVDFFPISR